MGEGAGGAGERGGGAVGRPRAGRTPTSGPVERSAAPAWGSYAEFYRRSAYGAFEQEHRRGGALGLTMIDVDQGAIEMVDPAVPELIIVSSRTNAVSEVNYGDGWVRRRRTPTVVDVQPAFQRRAFRLSPMSLRFATVKEKVVVDLLDEVGVAPAALDAVTGVFRELPRARELVDRLWGSMNGTGAATALLTDGLFMTLVGELLEASGQGTLPAVLPGAGDRRLIRAMEYVEAHLDTALTMGELAGVATMSRSGFARAFREAYGKPVWSWVQDRRTARALELLRGTNVPIAEVSKRCGFASQSHLTSVLRRQHGTTVESVRGG